MIIWFIAFMIMFGYQSLIFILELLANLKLKLIESQSIHPPKLLMIFSQKSYIYIYIYIYVCVCVCVCVCILHNIYIYIINLWVQQNLFNTISRDTIGDYSRGTK